MKNNLSADYGTVTTVKLSELPTNLSFFSLCQIQDIFQYTLPATSIRLMPEHRVSLDEFGNIWAVDYVGVKFNHVTDPAHRMAMRNACLPA